MYRLSVKPLLRGHDLWDKDKLVFQDRWPLKTGSSHMIFSMVGQEKGDRQKIWQYRSTVNLPMLSPLLSSHLYQKVTFFLSYHRKYHMTWTCFKRSYLPVQSVPITTKVMSSNPAPCEVYSIQLYMIKFVSDLRQVNGFLRIVRFPPPIKLTAMI
jgi:hypothetical protein